MRRRIGEAFAANPPLLYAAGQAAPTALTRTGMALGILPGGRYEQRTIQLAPGDFMLLYTDGVTDALNGDRQRYGEEALHRVLAEHRDQSAPALLDALDQSLRAHVGGTPPYDDITLMLVKRP